MALPADFDRDRWFDPLTFQGLIGSALAYGCYRELFRESGGFAKSRDELLSSPNRHVRRLAHEAAGLATPKEPTASRLKGLIAAIRLMLKPAPR